MNIYLFVCFLLVLSCFSFMVLFARRKGGRHVHEKKKTHTQTANTCPLDLNLSS